MFPVLLRECILHVRHRVFRWHKLLKGSIPIEGVTCHSYENQHLDLEQSQAPHWDTTKFVLGFIIAVIMVYIHLRKHLLILLANWLYLGELFGVVGVCRFHVILQLMRKEKVWV